MKHTNEGWTKVARRGRRARALLRNERGAGLVEFLVVVTLIGLGALAGVRLIRDGINQAGDHVGGAIIALRSDQVSLDWASRAAPGSAEALRAPDPNGDAFAADPELDPNGPSPDQNFSSASVGGFSYAYEVATDESTELGPDGEKLVTLEITRTQQGELGVTVPLGRGAPVKTVPELEQSVFVGEELSYGVTLPQAEHDAVMAGLRPLPDPSDLSSLPDGASIVLEAVDFAGSNSSVGYGVFGLESEVSTGHGSAISVEADGDSVRVLAGPTDVIKNASQVGVSALGLGREIGLQDTQFQFAEFQRGAAQGLYEEFVRTGEVPAGDALGVTDSGTVRQFEVERSVDGEFTIPLGLGETNAEFPGFSAKATLTEVTHADGRVETSLVQPNDFGVVFFGERTFDANGQLVSSDNGFVLPAEALDEATTRMLADAFGQSVDPDTGTFQLKLDQAQYTDLRNRYIAYLARQRDLDLFAADPQAPLFINSAVHESLLRHADVNDFFSPAGLAGKVGTTHSSAISIAEDLARIQYAGPRDQPLPGTAQFFED